MPYPHALHQILTKALLVSTLCVLTSACKRAEESAPPAPVAWSSTRAPYALVLPAGWQSFPPDVLNNGADFSANLEDRIMMVLATPVPHAPDAPEKLAEPKIARYAKESIAQLERDVVDFELVERKTTELGTHPAEIIIANGSVNDRQSRYMIAYTGVPGWRFQIVAWAHHSHAASLSDDFDAILSSWTVNAPQIMATDRDAGHLSKSD